MGSGGNGTIVCSETGFRSWSVDPRERFKSLESIAKLNAGGFASIVVTEVATHRLSDVEEICRDECSRSCTGMV